MRVGKMDKVIEARQLDYKIANALITSASAKIPLIDAFKKAINKINPKNKVIAADTSALALSQYVADQFWEMPVTDTSSVDKILTFCLANEVKCILPTRDGELAFWANQKELFKDNLRDTHWLGEVVDITDPEMLGRCRIRVFGKFDLLAVEDIPWAIPSNTSAMVTSLPLNFPGNIDPP